MEEDLGDLEQDFASAAKWLGIAILLLLALAWGSAAFAAPRAENERECTVAADMAVVARALAEEKLDRPKAELIMRRIYDVSPSARGQELLQTILQAAYSFREPASKFAAKLFTVCMSTGGNMDEVLGVSL
ncbi:MAG TPA: hypothetical protein VL280_05140 [Burkholderiales bacterium]|jgi:hypothetical protein|nr:hypothetical protein [Burkholderiales bacterium]